ncbi:MAG TPA: methyltransferase domain-containing protein, partial [bacterium]|nr:methyltransferase domain-containing protein [bacterium]
IGVDSSAELIKHAQDRNPGVEFLTIQEGIIPFPNNHFDIIFSLAVFHHIPGERMRLKMLSELKRVLKPGGKIIMTVWSLRHDKQIWQQLLRSKLRNMKLDWGDLLVPFKDKGGNVVAERYIHAFSQKELGDLAAKSGFEIEKSAIIARGKKKYNENILIVLKK